MNPPTDDIDLKPETLEEEKEGGALFHCDLYDADIVHKIAQEFLPGLASACIDNTTGGLFRNPASVAVDIRREMVDYLIQRSENFVAESVVLDGGPNEEVSDDPYDIISDFVDDFASTKRNFFSRVSGWLLSDKREDRIDDFVQEMEINGFWLLNRRESVAQTLLKNVDFKNFYHCNMSFKSPEDLEEHKLNCGFRTMICTNEGCNSRFSAAQADHHDSICPFKILKCEQNCPANIMRREMDRHCITICPMKLVKCPFYSVGCHSSVPQCTIEQHRSENLSSHLVYILQAVHKEASAEDLKERVEELIKLSSPGKLIVARDARALTFMIKDADAKLGPLKIKTTEKSSDGVRDSTDKKEESAGGLPTKEVKFEESPKAKTESVNSPSESSDSKDDSSQEKEKLVESPRNVSVQLESQPDEKNVVASISEQKNLKESPESPHGREDGLAAENETEAQMEKSSKDTVAETVKHEHFTSSPSPESSPGRDDGLAAENKTEAQMEKSSKDTVAETVEHEHFTSSPSTESSLGRDGGLASQNKIEVEMEMENSSEDKVAEPVKHEHFTSSRIKVEKDKREKQTDLAAENEESTNSGEESKGSYN